MKNWSILVLISIIIVGFVIRFISLNVVPPALNWDEVSVGYNAYSILKSGRDEWGALPIANFRAYGDYPTTFYLYTLVPVIGFFGLNEISVRLPSVIFGTLTILAVYLLAKTIFKGSKRALLPAMLVAFSPWAILPSRQAIQVVPAICLVTFGVWLSFQRNFKAVLFGTIFLGLSAYAYHNTRILAPIFFLILILVNWSYLIKNRLKLLTVLVVAGFFFIPLAPILFSGEGSARAAWVGILDEGAINRINQSRGQSQLPEIFSKLVNNKLTYFGGVFSRNYLGYFSPTFLSLEGGTHFQFSVPNYGLIYPIEIGFFYLGVALAAVSLGNKLTAANIKLLNNGQGTLFVLLLLLLLSPIPAAITRDPYQVVRGFLMVPFVYIFISIGFWVLVDFFRSKSRLAVVILTVVVGFGLAFFSVNYLYNLFYLYPKEYSFAWQYGYKSAVGYILVHQERYSKIYVTKKYGEAHEFLLFYSQYDPKRYRDDPNLVRYKRSDWYWVDSFGKYVFVNDWEVKEKLAGQMGVLLITSPGNYPSGGKVLETIYFLDGAKAFDVVAL